MATHNMIMTQSSEGVHRVKRYFTHVLLILLMFSVNFGSVYALGLESIDFSALPGNKLQLNLGMNGPAFSPKVFSTDNPARISMDFPGVINGLKKKIFPVNVGVTSSVHAIEASGRTRVVVNLLEMVPYDVTVDGDDVLVSLGNKERTLSNNVPVVSEAETVVAQLEPKLKSAARSHVTKAFPKQTIKNIDFRRGTEGEGRVLISLTDPNTIVDIQQEGNKVILYFINTTLPKSLAKRLDVTDFGTPIESVETVIEGSRVKMVVLPSTSNYDYLSYQTDGLLTLEFRPLTKAEKEVLVRKKFKYIGESLSLNFQDIAIRSVLQILADFTDLNVVASDTVEGNITLRLNDVPWDQALDIILKSKGLSKRQTGNVILVAPSAEMNKAEKEELEALAFKEQLEPLRTEIIQVNYAKAEDIQAVLIGVQNIPNGGAASEDSQYTENFPDESMYAGDDASNRGNILSKRGVVNIDERTNILIVKDTPSNLEAVRKLVKELDKPVRQVLIEARVVIANNDFLRELGVRFGATKRDFTPGDGSQSGFEVGGASTNGLITDLPAAIATGSGGALGLTFFKIGDYLLNLELSALQADDKGEVISNPRLITSNQKKAKIIQGTEIPFQTFSQNGTKTEFKEAVLKLEVTPQITPDNHVLMELLVQKDAPGAETRDGLAIDKREIQTTVQVESGETVVLGGVFEGETRETVNKVPFFGDLPGVGYLFRKTAVVNSKTELLIFITPRILKKSLASL